jgi:hypothetical protein
MHTNLCNCDHFGIGYLRARFDSNPNRRQYLSVYRLESKQGEKPEGVLSRPPWTGFSSDNNLLLLKIPKPYVSRLFSIAHFFSRHET